MRLDAGPSLEPLGELITLYRTGLRGWTRRERRECERNGWEGMAVNCGREEEEKERGEEREEKGRVV